MHKASIAGQSQALRRVLQKTQLETPSVEIIPVSAIVPQISTSTKYPVLMWDTRGGVQMSRLSPEVLLRLFKHSKLPARARSPFLAERKLTPTCRMDPGSPPLTSGTLPRLIILLKMQTLHRNGPLSKDTRSGVMSQQDILFGPPLKGIIGIFVKKMFLPELVSHKLE